MGERLCLVAGASGRLGGEIARELARRGWAVGLHWHTAREEVSRAAADCRAAGARAFEIRADLRSREAAEALVSELEHLSGRAPGLLVAATGVSRPSLLLRTSEQDWDESISVNLSGPAWLLRACAARWAEGPEGGHAILLGSHAALAGLPGGAAYSASKAALVGLARSVARELGRSAVRVNVILPPFVAEGRMGLSASREFAEEAARRSVLGKAGSARELARFVADLAETSGISGQVLAADARIA